MRRVLLGAIAIVLVALVIVAAVRFSKPARPQGLAVPRSSGGIKIDGETEDPGWQSAMRSGGFVGADGKEVHPFSEVRFTRDDNNLYVLLYAADEDVHADESFHLEIGALAFDVTPLGKLKPDIPGARVGNDLDGTLDDPEDDDEEWVLEISLPLASLGKGPLSTKVSRCDRPKNTASPICGSYAAVLRVDP